MTDLLAPFPLGGEFGCSLFVNPIQESVEFFPGIQGHVVTAVGRFEAFFGGGPQPIELGFVFLLALT